MSVFIRNGHFLLTNYGKWYIIDVTSRFVRSSVRTLRTAIKEKKLKKTKTKKKQKLTDFEPIEKQNSYVAHEYGVIRNCRYLLGKMAAYSRGSVARLIACGFTSASMGYIWSFIGKLVVDMIERQTAGGQGDIIPLLILVAITTVITFFAMWANTWLTSKLSLDFIYVRLMLCRERIKKVLSMDYEQLENPEMLDRHHRAKRATSGDWIGVQGLMQQMGLAAAMIISLIAALAIISTLNIWLVLILIALSAVQFLYFDHIRKLDKKVMWDAMAGHWRKLDYVSSIAGDFSFAKDIRLYSMKNFLAQKHHEVNEIELAHWKASRNYWIRNSIFGHGISLIRSAAIYGWIIVDFLNGNISIGDCTLYIASAFQFANSAQNFLQSVSGIRERSTQTDDFRDFMDAQVTKNAENPKPIPETDRYVFEFKNVSFRYPSQENYALKNLNLTLEAGQRLAVVGLNGAGKTTFIKLLLRLYDVTEGVITLNGTDIREFDRVKYYELFAPAFQEAEVLAFPMDENVSMKDPQNTDAERAEKMLRAAGLGDKLDKLPNGSKTELLKVLYDDGIDLSGGEKQKLALARALYKNAPIVVLDEPTAALDAIAEYQLYQNFNDMIGEKTAVYISHRLSSTRFCDIIAMFKDGEMVEYGTHEELLAKNGAYAEMFRVQAQYYVEDGEGAEVNA